MRGKRNPWLLVVLLLAGALIGGFVGEFLSRYPYFTWISFGGTNGYRELFGFSFTPLIDSGTLRLGFDVALRINAGSILGMIISILIFLRL